MARPNVDGVEEVGVGDDVVEAKAGKNEVSSEIENFDIISQAPEEFRDRQWLKDAKDYPNLVKNYDNMQKLLGSRQVVPGQGATQEEIDSFFLGVRPEKKESYDFPNKDLGESDVGKLQQVFHDAGLHQAQVDKLISSMSNMSSETIDNYEKAKRETQNKEFDVFMKDKFGESKDEAFTKATTLLRELVPQDLSSKVKDMGNEELGILTVALNNVYDKYIKPDSVSVGSVTSVVSEQQLIQDMQNIMRTPEYSDTMDPAYDVTKARVAEISEKIARLRKK